MNQLIQGTITGPYTIRREEGITISIPEKGYKIIMKGGGIIKDVYEKTFLYDFQKIITSKVN